jgi:hypothetical protein
MKLSFTVTYPAIALLLLLRCLGGSFVVQAQQFDGDQGCYVDGTDALVGYIPTQVDRKCCTNTAKLFGYENGNINQDTSSQLLYQMETCNDLVLHEINNDALKNVLQCQLDRLYCELP